jgi:hypothetical protein
MTRRERMENRLAKREEWARGRDRKAAAAFGSASSLSSSIPFGQPILIGHHSERRARNDAKRIQNRMMAGLECSDMADNHRSKAANIKSALDRTIFSDDANAVERLTEKISRLKIIAERIKKYNESARKAAKTGGTGDITILSEWEQKDLASLIKNCPYQLRDGNAFPAYRLTYISADIKRANDRILTINKLKEVK